MRTSPSSVPGTILAITEGLQQTAFTDFAAGDIFSNLPRGAPLVPVSFAENTHIPLFLIVLIEAVALNTYFFPYPSAVFVAILKLDVVDSTELSGMMTIP